MQISRHWRIKPQRYRLEGMRFENGEITLQTRPVPMHETPRDHEVRDEQRAPQPVLAR